MTIRDGRRVLVDLGPSAPAPSGRVPGGHVIAPVAAPKAPRDPANAGHARDYYRRHHDRILARRRELWAMRRDAA